MDLGIVLLVLVGAVAMALGPVLMLKPSSSERRQAELRDKAARLGLLVQVGAPPQQGSDLAPPKQMAIYCRPRSESSDEVESWLLLRAAYTHESHLMGDWAWYGRGRPSMGERERLETVLPSLPASVLGIGADNRGWYVYWTERDGAQTLMQLSEQLSALSGNF